MGLGGARERCPLAWPSTEAGIRAKVDRVRPRDSHRLDVTSLCEHGPLRVIAMLLAVAACEPEPCVDEVCLAESISVRTTYAFDHAARVRVGTEDLLVSVMTGRAMLIVSDRAGSTANHELPGPARGLVAGDLDGDGLREEIAIASENPPQIDLYRVAQDRTVEHLETVAIGEGPRSLAIADLDGDGLDDLVTADAIDGALSVVLGDRTRTRIEVGESPFVIEIGDLNGDAALDLATLDFFTGDLTLLFGDGAGSFADRATFGLAPGATELAVGDIDGDGDLDLAVLGVGTDRWLALGEGAAGLGPLHELPLDVEPRRNDERRLILTPPGADGLGGIGHVEGELLSLSLVDGDTFEGGQVRLGIRGFTGTLAPAPPFLFVQSGYQGKEFFDIREGPVPTLRWQHSFEPVDDDDLSEEEEPPSAPPARPLTVGSVLAADLNDDGDVDLVAARDDLVILLGDGSGAFIEASSVDLSSLGPSRVEQVHAADFDGDGDVDLWVQTNREALLATGDASGQFELAPRLTSLASGSPQTLLLGGSGWTRVVDYDTRHDGQGLDLYRPDPSGTFILEATLVADRTPSLVEAGDLDLDGDEELIVVSGPPLDPHARVISVLRRSGPTYTEGPRHDLAELEEKIGWIAALTIGDSDLNGSPEVIALAEGGFASLTGLEDDEPTILLHPTEPTEIESALTFTEVDDDALPDLTYIDRTGDLATIYGASGFTGEIDRFGLPNEKYTLVDVDGDGRVELIAHTLTSLSASHLEVHRSPRVVERWRSSSGFAWEGADLDGDGRAEVVVITFEGFKIITAPTSARPQIRAVSLSVDEPGGWAPAGIFDLDDDGREEVMFREVGPTDPTYFLLHDEDGELRVTQILFPAELREPLAGPIGLADFDGDGQRDFAFGLSETMMIAYDVALEGAGPYTLTAASVETVLESVDLPVKILDLDHDGRADIVTRERIAGVVGPVVVAFSDHEGRWSKQRLPADALFIRPAEGELLLLEGSALHRQPFYRGQALAPIRVIDDPRLEGAHQVGVGDFDGDGQTDIISTRGSGELTIWRARSESLLFGYSRSQVNGAVADDFDGDGRSDLLLTGAATDNEILLSETRR